MFAAIKKLFSGSPAVDYGALIKNGAVIIDVRTPGEFKSGHVKGSLNIPLDQLAGSVKKIKASGPVIVCCASGMRSASAKNILKGKGFTEVYNAGAWTKLRKYAN